MSTNLRKLGQTLFYFFRLGTLALLPSYILRRLRNEPPKAARALPTSYLDGFRGVMAFLVFVRHFSLPWQSDLDYGFGQGEDHTGIFRLPVLRILYAGPNVPVFLIVSGYVMSLKPLKLLKIGDREVFLKSMVSSIFRRAIRIFLPPILSTFMFMVAVHFKLFDDQYEMMQKFVPHHPDHLSNFLDQFKDWAYFVLTDLTNPWTWEPVKSVYGGHLWTVPLQFRCSIVLFLVLIGLANTRVRVRQGIQALLFIYCMSSGRWDVALYLSGMLMVESETKSQNKSNESSTLPFDSGESITLPKVITVRSRIFWSSKLLIGLYLSSFPRARDGVGAPGYMTLYSISSDYHYWQGFGAIFLVWSLFSYKPAQKAFDCHLAQYLGKISYSLYIVHEPLLHILGYHMVKVAWIMTGEETTAQYQFGFILALSLTTLILLWVADIFQRVVDDTCADLSRWIENKCS